MRRPALPALALAITASLVLAACGGETDPEASGSPTTTTDTAESPEPSPTSTFPEPDPTVTAEDGSGMVAVGDNLGSEPYVDFPTGDPSAELVIETVVQGDGDTVEEGDLVVADYVVSRWPDATPTSTTTPKKKKDQELPARDNPLMSSFRNERPEAFTVTTEATLSAMHQAFLGSQVGSRVVVVSPPADAWGEQGNPGIGVDADDTVVIVLDIVAVFPGDAAASGTPVALDDPDLPTVTDGDDGPVVEVPAVDPPTELVVETLVEGDGPEVEAGQLLVVQYRGVLWKDGSEFDSSWSRDAPSGFFIGVRAVITGWDEGLVGQKAGSRVLLVVPPADGYGEAGSPPDIGGDDTLVFVVDVLGSYGSLEVTDPAG